MSIDDLKLINDPRPVITYAVELFADDDPAEPIPDAIGRQHRDAPGADLPGPRLRRPQQGGPGRGRIPAARPGDLPVLMAGGEICIALDWLQEQALPEYASWWARVRGRVARMFPKRRTEP